MPDTIILEFYEHRPTRFSNLTDRVKVAELDVSKMTVPQLDKIREIQEMLGRTFEIKRLSG